MTSSPVSTLPALVSLVLIVIVSWLNLMVLASTRAMHTHHGAAIGLEAGRSHGWIVRAMAAHHRLIVIPVDHSLGVGEILIDPVIAPIQGVKHAVHIRLLRWKIVHTEVKRCCKLWLILWHDVHVSPWFGAFTVDFHALTWRWRRVPFASFLDATHHFRRSGGSLRPRAQVSKRCEANLNHVLVLFVPLRIRSISAQMKQ